MSLMKRMLSSVGIGSAKVDTILEKDRYEPGETVDAVVRITGGKVEQHIEEIYFSLHCNYEAEVERHGDERTESRVAVLDKFRLGESLLIGVGETLELPLSFELPIDTPITVGRTKVWVQTGLDIKKAKDPEDRDYIHVAPGHLSGAVFDAMYDLGFELFEAECEAVQPGRYNQFPFIQEFEFRPVKGPFRGRFDEVEIVFFPDYNQVEVLMEIDRRARGFGGFISEMMDTDETRVRFTVLEEDLPNLANHLHNLINNYG